MDKEQIKKLTGLRIKELRKKNGFTQEKLAELTEIGERNLSKIECGKNFISAETLAKLVTAFKTTPDEIFKFEHLNNDEILKKELIEKLQNNEIDANLLYRIYKSL